MQTKIGTSTKKNAEEAFSEASQGLGKPGFLMVLSPYAMLEEVAELVKRRFPETPSMGTSSTTYFGGSSHDERLVLVAFGEDAKAEVGVVGSLSRHPAQGLLKLDQALRSVQPGQDNTICLEFCTNDEERLVTTLNIELEKYGVPLAGGTVFGYPAGAVPYVMVNGTLYTDACCYAVIKNLSGRVHSYSENIYAPMAGTGRHIATKVDLPAKKLVRLDGRPAAEVYSEELGIPKEKLVDNVLKTPLGRVVGEQVFISSLYDMDANGAITLYKRLNENDTVSVLSLRDYPRVNDKTVETLRNEAPQASFLFTVNCIYRHLLFQQERYLPTLLEKLEKVAPHVGVVGGGEQYQKQHVNQTMVCVVFE